MYLARDAIRPLKLDRPRMLKHATLPLPHLLIKASRSQTPHVLLLHTIRVIDAERAVIFALI